MTGSATFVEFRKESNRRIDKFRFEPGDASFVGVILESLKTVAV